MVNVIVADVKHDCSHLLGQFADESNYDILIESDTDCYMPPLCDILQKSNCIQTCNSCDKGKDERRIAFKFRKNYFSKEEQEQAYLGLREAANISFNRGFAAGPIDPELDGRMWVTDYEYDVLDYFLDPVDNLYGDDPIEDLRIKYSNKPVVFSTQRSKTWLSAKLKKENFVFDEWVDRIKNKPIEERKVEANYVATKLIASTSYASATRSGIAGWFGRYTRIPYGRATSYTRDNYEKFAMSFPFLQTLSKGFKELLPWRYNNQKLISEKIDQGYLVPGTVFTTITVNKTFRTACHYDAGDYSDGLSNLLVLSNNGNYTGGYLIFPEYRIAVNVRPGDLLLVNNHEVMHGNTEIILGDETAERVSLVCYFRENMLELGSVEYEECRYNFIESRRTNKNHPKQRPLWNGISPGLFLSQEWYDYCEKKLGRVELEKYHPEAIQGSTLDGFF